MTCCPHGRISVDCPLCAVERALTQLRSDILTSSLVLILWIVLTAGVVLSLWGCGDTYNEFAAQAPPAAPLTTPTVSAMVPCAPPATPAMGHQVRGHTYRVWSQDCTRVQAVTMWWDTAEPGPEWPTPAVPCTRVDDVTPVPCG